MEKLFSEVSQERINKDLGVIYEGYKDRTIVDIYRGKKTIPVPVDAYGLMAQVYIAKDPKRRPIMTLDFGLIATRSNKIAELVSKLKRKPFPDVETLAKIVSLAAREERGTFMHQAQLNHRFSGQHPKPPKKWVAELDKIAATSLSKEETK